MFPCVLSVNCLLSLANRLIIGLTPAVKFLELIFRNSFFLSSILAKCVQDESCRGEFPPTSPKGLVLEAQRHFCGYR